MVKEYVALCDLCLGDGEKVIAVATYWSDEGREWDCCARHLKDVKELGLKYEKLDKDEE